MKPLKDSGDFGVECDKAVAAPFVQLRFTQRGKFICACDR